MWFIYFIPWIMILFQGLLIKIWPYAQNSDIISGFYGLNHIFYSGFQDSLRFWLYFRDITSTWGYNIDFDYISGTLHQYGVIRKPSSILILILFFNYFRDITSIWGYQKTLQVMFSNSWSPIAGALRLQIRHFQLKMMFLSMVAPLTTRWEYFLYKFWDNSRVIFL